MLLFSKNIILDFDKFLTFRSKTNCTKVRCKSNFVVPPNVAMFVYGTLDKKLLGYQVFVLGMIYVLA